VIGGAVVTGALVVGAAAPGAVVTGAVATGVWFAVDAGTGAVWCESAGGYGEARQSAPHARRSDVGYQRKVLSIARPPGRS
jgi:hypothetical protein